MKMTKKNRFINLGVVAALVMGATTAYGAGSVSASGLTQLTTEDALQRIQQRVAQLQNAVVTGSATPQERDGAMANAEEFAKWIKANEFGSDDKLVRLYGRIEGSPIFDDWPTGWSTASTEEFGTLYIIETEGGLTYIAAKEQYEDGTVLFAFGEEQLDHAAVIAIDETSSIALDPKMYTSLLKNSPRDLIEEMYFNHVMARKAHDLFPEVIDNPDGPVVEFTKAQKVKNFVTDKKNIPLLFGGVVLLALLGGIVVSLLPKKAASGDVAVGNGEGVAEGATESEGHAGGEEVEGGNGEELCPYHNVPLINGECPHGCTITRCAECGAIMKDGKCPNGCRAPEYCPSCGSQLMEDGSCPRGCTIIRCNNCNAILKEGICPNGCNADPLNFGWGGATKPEMTNYALEVVTPEEYAGFSAAIPDFFVVGRSARDATEAFLELLVLDNSKKQSCSRRYVEFRLAQDGTGFDVSMLKNHNFAYVNNRKISREGETERIYEGETIKLNPDFELRLVRIAEEAPAEEAVSETAE